MANRSIVQSRLKRVDGLKSFWTSQLEAVAKSLEQAMRENIAAASGGNATIDAALARAQVQALLTQSGYYTAVGDLFGKGYQEIIDGLFKDYGKLIPNLQFTDVSAKTLQMIKDRDLQVFMDLSETQATNMQRVLLNYSFGVSDRQAAFDELNSITSDLSNTSSLAVDTAISGFEQQVSNMIATDSGIEYFEYVGPDDNITRPFCAEHLGEVKTLEEWSKLDNGQGLPVQIYVGGWNCRHTLESVIQ